MVSGATVRYGDNLDAVPLMTVSAEGAAHVKFSIVGMGSEDEDGEVGAGHGDQSDLAVMWRKSALLVS